MDLATRLSQEKLSALRAQRQAEVMQERYEHGSRSVQQREDEIERLQKALSESDVRFQQQEEQWRQKLRNGQQFFALGDVPHTGGGGTEVGESIRKKWSVAGDKESERWQ